MINLNLEVYSAKLKNKNMLSKCLFCIVSEILIYLSPRDFEFKIKFDEIKINDFYS